MLRRVTPFLLIFSVLAVSAGTASASQAPKAEEMRSGPPRVYVDPAVISKGERINIRGKNWKPRSKVRLAIGPPQSEAFPFGKAKVNKRGRFRKSVRMFGAPGLYVIVTCSSSSCRDAVRTRVRVVKGSPKKQKTLLHTEFPKPRYAKKPKSIGYEGSVANVFLETIEVRGLKWKRWGKGRSTSQGRATVCVGGGCKSSPVKVKATRRVRYESEEWFYSRVVVTFRKDVGIYAKKVMLCTLPGICGGKPGPP